MKLSFRQTWAEFKAFAFKGNMVDLAVAVVIGAAFSGVINSLVKDIIMPTVSYAVTAAREAKEAASNVASKAGSVVRGQAAATTQSATEPAAKAEPAPAPPPAAPAAAPPAADDRPVDMNWRIGRLQVGHFIAEVLNFIIVAFAVFMIMVKVLGSVMKRVSPPPPPGEPTTKECPRCLSIIPTKATKCAHCTADLPEAGSAPVGAAAPAV
jgi:large conductance mechanosensitive channel